MHPGGGCGGGGERQREIRTGRRDRESPAGWTRGRRSGRGHGGEQAEPPRLRQAPGGRRAQVVRRMRQAGEARNGFRVRVRVREKASRSAPSGRATWVMRTFVRYRPAAAVPASRPGRGQGPPQGLGRRRGRGRDRGRQGQWPPQALSPGLGAGPGGGPRDAGLGGVPGPRAASGSVSAVEEGGRVRAPHTRCRTHTLGSV